MGLFSKLFGDNKEVKEAFESAAKTVLSGAEKKFGDLGEEAKSIAAEIKSAAQASDGREAYAPAAKQAAPSGLSWGEEMPDEPNQFNYPGPYDRYFDNLFRTEFPEYDITCKESRYGKALVYTFRKDQRTALIVELLPQRSSVYKLRRDCATMGIPYLRYYYDHEGWWNTYSYVTERTRAALNG